MPADRRTWLAYVAPPLAVALAMSVRMVLWPQLFVDATFLPAFAAVLFCAWLGGLGPGLAAMALGGLAMIWWIFQPSGSVVIAGTQQQVQIVLYLLFSLAIVLACESLHRVRRRAQTLRGDILALEAAQGQLRVLAAHLSEMHRRKDEFLATLAHELRNPLAPMRNSLEVLRLDDSRPSREQARQTMERQLAHLVRLVDDLLDVSRITRDKLPLRRETIALADVVRNVEESARPQLQGLGHELELQLPDAPVYLHADPVRIAQVLGNLLHNAGKFTPRGGHVRLRAVPGDGTVVITVDDDGIGVRSEQHDHVFEMFRQGDASLERTHGGLGIGLGLARRLVELHGGEIALHSDGPGQGTQVRVCLPVVPGPSASEAAVAPAPAPAAMGPGEAAPAGTVPAESAPSSHRVLVADDNTDAADSMAMMLRLLGHEALVARDGLTAVAIAQRERPDLVLLDIGMPGLNGYEVCRRLRALPWGASLRIVAVTGWGQDSDRARSRDAGFDEHLVKPLSPAQLRRLLELPRD
jgi:signal transduction histidine kinase/CheY-like chemotaxis protein